MWRLTQDLGHRQYSAKGSQDCGTSDACSFHFTMPKISLKAWELFLPFLKLLYVGLFPVTTLETDITKLIWIRSSKPKPWPQPTSSKRTCGSRALALGNPQPPPAPSYTFCGKPGFAALKALSLRLNLSCTCFQKLDGICSLLKYAEGN